MRTYETTPGEHIDHCAAEMVKLADFTGEPVTAMFNDVPLDTAPGGDAAEIVKAFREETNRRHAEYIASPEYAERQREARESEARKAKLLSEALTKAPAKLTVKDAVVWDKWLAEQSDGYGQAIFSYADKWARVMESRMQHGVTVEECAKAASHIADDEGITGFMYGAAVAVLGKCWIHGEALRRWHNLETQIGTEGERANEMGGTLNPALLSVG